MAQHALSEAHREFLTGAAIRDEFLTHVHSAGDSIVFEHTSYTGAVLRQTRPMEPAPGAPKYLYEKGQPLILPVPPGSRDQVADVSRTLVMVEGTKGHLAAASWVDPKRYAVVGLLSCWGWSREADGVSQTPIPCLFELPIRGRDVIVLMDGDLVSNHAVYSAAAALATKLEVLVGAKSVTFALNPGGGKSSVDDVLGQLPEAFRADALARILASAKELHRAVRKPPPRPALVSGAGGLAVARLYEALEARHPMAATSDGTVAVYRGGVYRNGASREFGDSVRQLLGDDYRPAHVKTAEAFALDHLTTTSRVVPDRPGRPLINLTNGLLSLEDLKLRPHDPSYMSVVQLRVSWEPTTSCPTYERWIRDVAGDQVDALEETIALMLDPEQPPTRAGLLFGPSRSGKSTVLRLAEKVVGDANRSSISLHDLARNAFAAAEVYGKILNVCADLPASHVQDLSSFKQMLGEDSVQGNRKYGQMFSFRNHALFLFSANELPSVSETSGAYLARMRPFEFPHSFAGHEDRTLERRLAAELPGILHRWVRALKRVRETGAMTPVSATVFQEFARQSDSVRLFLSERTEPHDVGTLGSLLYQEFVAWSVENGRPKMGSKTFFQRVQAAGVSVTKREAGMTYSVRLTPPGAAPSAASNGNRSAQSSSNDDFKNPRARGNGDEGAEGAGFPPSSGEIAGLGSWSTDPSSIQGAVGPVAIDVETTGLGADLVVRTIQLAGSTESGRSALLIDLETDPSAGVLIAKEILEELDGRLYSFSGFDARALVIDGRFPDVRILDVAPLAHRHDPRTGIRGLKELMRANGLGAYVSTVTGEATIGMPTTDLEFRVYAVTDALALHVLIETWGGLEGREEWLERENRIAEVAHQMQVRGAAIDRAELEALHSSYQGSGDTAAAEAITLEPEVSNIRSRPQLLAAAERRAVALPTVRRKGSVQRTVSTSRKALHTDDPFFTLVQRATADWSAAAKTKELLAAVDESGRIHTRWRTLGARSSRWTSSKPAMQNLAKHGERVEIRSVFVPAPDRVFVQADLSQIEYRVAAALSGDEQMLQAFAESGDLHLHAARVLSGRPEPTKQDRSSAKGIGFGKLYGQTLEGSATAAGVSRMEMRARIAEYDAHFPRLAQWCKEVRAHATRLKRSPVSPYGRVFPVPGAHAAVNYLCQSTAREIFCDWLLAVDQEFPGSIVLAVHDELILEVAPDVAIEVAGRVAELAEVGNAGRPDPLRLVPIVAEAAIADSWSGAY